MNKIIYTCQSCGFQSPKWLGKCPDCGKWNSLTEEKTENHKTAGHQSAAVLSLEKIESISHQRISTGCGEFDRVLGGGIVPASVILVGGEPGIGKSTLLLQMSALLSAKAKVMYVLGEESPQQLKMRAERLGISGAGSLLLFPETTVEFILDAIKNNSPAVVVIDSIQTMNTASCESAPGTVSQIRECTQKLVAHAKESGTSLIIVGHVTKEGTIAGPKILEHMVDTVIYFEGERKFNFRILRTVKNRFGSTNEIGIFQMTGQGLSEVLNPAELFLSDRSASRAGIQVTTSMEGTRPMLCEIESLTNYSSFGNGRRLAQGIEVTRIFSIIAVIEKYLGIKTAEYDVYVNVVGGLKVFDPASDLAVALAVYSSFRNKPPRCLFSLGELSLTSEIRIVPFMNERIREGAKLGYQKMILPKGKEKITESFEGVEIIEVCSLEEAVEAGF
ncbi:MAG: DNA repair protein RadA [Candidatus Wallbacteria bacterium]|nr:DNA repair protein RadA [Candidatus Wallbacteria bacterium]